MTYDHWKTTEPEEWAEHVCERCKRRAADAFDVTGTWLCADCMFDEADPDAAARNHVEQGSSKR